MSADNFDSSPRWLNADGTTSPITKATADTAPTEPEGPSQEFLQALVATEQDRLRAEGWRACVEHIQRQYGGLLTGEDTYWVRRHNPYIPAAVPPTHTTTTEDQ